MTDAQVKLITDIIDGFSYWYCVAFVLAFSMAALWLLLMRWGLDRIHKADATTRK